jgi:hypothetical protein
MLCLFEAQLFPADRGFATDSLEDVVNQNEAGRPSTPFFVNVNTDVESNRGAHVGAESDADDSGSIDGGGGSPLQPPPQQPTDDITVTISKQHVHISLIVLLLN